MVRPGTDATCRSGQTGMGPDTPDGQARCDLRRLDWHGCSGRCAVTGTRAPGPRDQCRRKPGTQGTVPEPEGRTLVARARVVPKPRLLDPTARPHETGGGL